MWTGSPADIETEDKPHSLVIVSEIPLQIATVWVFPRRGTRSTMGIAIEQEDAEDDD
jgi:hypothetical protein